MRVLLGIAESCYIPAALALIADYHRTTTRSLAIGVHMTGIMVGSGLGGLGGWIPGLLEAAGVTRTGALAATLLFLWLVTRGPARPAGRRAGVRS